MLQIRRTRPNFQRPVSVTPPPAPERIDPWRVAVMVAVLLGGGFAVLIGRYFWLQVVRGEHFEMLAQRQYQADSSEETGNRGRIYDVNGNLLVSNRKIYRIYVQANQVADAGQLYDQLQPLILADREASASIRPREQFVSLVQEAAGRSNWIWLTKRSVSQETKEKIDALTWPCESKAAGKCVKYEVGLRRYYPEGSLAAHVLGFFKRDNSGGSYGIEQGMDLELSGQSRRSLDDAELTGEYQSYQPDYNLDGRDVYLTLDRDLQYLVESTLADGIARFGASRGEIIITEPATGRILAMAAYPTYEPEYYNEYDPASYKNPSILDNFEPGSIFKVITMAAAVDAGLVSPDTRCQRCDGPRKVAGATINNWDFKVNGPITMTEALEKSDNIALVWVSDLLGSDRFNDYIEKFGFKQPVEVEVNERAEPPALNVWGPVETATRSFGQGIAVTSLQMVRAVGAIANGGNLMQMTFVDHVVDQATGQTYYTQPQVSRRVISEQAAQTLQTMMQTSAQHGEAQYIFKNSGLIAGKTGTAQIPREGGGGYEDDTIASFIGFAPYNDAKFLMYIKYERPQTSIYAAETAAVTWKELAEKLFLRFNIRGESGQLTTDDVTPTASQ